MISICLQTDIPDELEISLPRHTPYVKHQPGSARSVALLAWGFRNRGGIIVHRLEHWAHPAIKPALAGYLPTGIVSVGLTVSIAPAFRLKSWDINMKLALVSRSLLAM
jgi:hypothetical protein